MFPVLYSPALCTFCFRVYRQNIFFPLHTEIERTLLITAPFYLNQIEIIKNIAKSIPINYTLIVKEHPFQTARGWRSTDEYNEIMNIPNVELVHPTFPNEKL